MEKLCLNCGRSFQSKLSSNRKFCSRQCESLFKKGKSAVWNKKEPVEVFCSTCGKTEYVRPSRARTYKTCSYKCMGIYFQKRYTSYSSSQCVICGKAFQSFSSKKRRKQTCSMDCKIKLRLSYKKALQNNYRVVVEKYLGIKIDHKYQIHHKDCIKTNNDISNLIILSPGEHTYLHSIFGRAPLTAYYKNFITKEQLMSGCELLYSKKEIEHINFLLDLDLNSSAVLKFCEFGETPVVDNTEPSVKSDLNEGVTTSSESLVDNNTTTSAGQS